MKKNDLVLLSKKAIKDFYGRPERIEDFVAGGNLEMLTVEQLLDFMDTYLGFENGLALGIINKITPTKVAHVIHWCPISQKWDTNYYELKDLKLWRK